MNDLVIAVALHVLCIVLCIGEVGFATIALLPALRHAAGSGQATAMFEAVESRCAPVACAARRSSDGLTWRIESECHA
jgi:uncharacterized membrane protein